MDEYYSPPSDFLCSIAADEVPLSGSPFAEANLRRLIGLTRDPDHANRDWATFLLAQSDIDTTEVREALLMAARANDDIVRDEALSGLAQRDRALALPLVQEALRGNSITTPALEAAEYCAHPSLIADLRVWAEPCGDQFIDERAAQALTACLAAGAKGQ
jgi:hypothetical protein